MAVRLEHVYDTDVADLWSAVTEPVRLARWFSHVEGDLSLGGDFLMVFDEEDPSHRTAGRVLECAPPTRLVIEWQSGLEALAADLRGEDGHGGRWDEREKELLPAYQARLER
jgi:uncharacterized protein YndB with AHSA1/START domain